MVKWSSLKASNRAKRARVTDDLRHRTSRGRKPQPRRFIAGCVMRLGHDKLYRDMDVKMKTDE